MYDFANISRARRGGGARTKKQAARRRARLAEAAREEAEARDIRRGVVHSSRRDEDDGRPPRPFLRPGDPGWTR